MTDMMVLNDSVRSTRLLVASGIGLFLGKAIWMVVGYRAKYFETVNMKSKGGERLVGADFTKLGAETRVALGVDVVFFL